MLPGLGPVATIAMLLPVTFGLEPVTALIMLAGIFYGAQYGGSTTAILVNLPGESSSVVTALDGYKMARQGRAGIALATAAIGSFFAGTVCTFLIALAAPPLSEVALQFGPADYFSLMVLGLVASIVLASGSLLHALGMIILGLLLGLIGTDVNSGTARFSFDMPELADGMSFVVIAMGVFGLGEIICQPPRPIGPFAGAGEDHRPDADARGLEAHDRADPARNGARARRWASFPAAARCCPPSPPTRWRRRCRATPPSSARAPSKGSPRPSRPTTPARRRRSSRC